MCGHASHQASADINFAQVYVYIQVCLTIFVWCTERPLEFNFSMSTVHLAMSEEQPSSTSPQLGNQVRACISALIERSVPAAQLPRSVVNHLTNSLLDLLGPRLPLLGGENRVEELLPLQVACPTCSSNLSKCYTLASDAVLVDVAAVIQKKTHSCTLPQQKLRCQWTTPLAQLPGIQGATHFCGRSCDAQMLHADSFLWIHSGLAATLP